MCPNFFKVLSIKSPSQKFFTIWGILALLFIPIGNAIAAAPPAISNEQCQPGPETGANGITSDCIANSNPNGWKTGNNDGPFFKGDSPPYRALMTGTEIGETYTLKIEYDITHGGEHALDYLTTFNRTMTNADACTDHASAIICDDVDTTPIPTDPQVTAGPDGIDGTADDVLKLREYSLYMVEQLPALATPEAQSQEVDQSVTHIYTA